MRTQRKAASPYQKYGKTPHRYSAAYYAWRRETLKANGLRESQAAAEAERASAIRRHHAMRRTLED
jgi:hypothetical protein